MFFLSPSSWYLQPTQAPAALGSATWPWHGDWFDRFCYTNEQRGDGAGQARGGGSVALSLPPHPQSHPHLYALVPSSNPPLKGSCMGNGKAEAPQTPVPGSVNCSAWDRGQVSLLGPHCLHLHNGALGSVILRPPHTMILVTTLPFALYLWASHST